MTRRRPAGRHVRRAARQSAFSVHRCSPIAVHSARIYGGLRKRFYGNPDEPARVRGIDRHRAPSGARRRAGRKPTRARPSMTALHSRRCRWPPGCWNTRWSMAAQLRRPPRPNSACRCSTWLRWISRQLAAEAGQRGADQQAQGPAAVQARQPAVCRHRRPDQSARAGRDQVPLQLHGRTDPGRARISCSASSSGRCSTACATTMPDMDDAEGLEELDWRCGDEEARIQPASTPPATTTRRW